MAQGERIIPVNIEEQMKSSYIDYSMSVIVSRALPDVRDGLKPVHRRVLYGMHDMGVTSTKAYKKSARIVGDVLGKYHPHGDSSVYDTMVRMAQDWSLRYMLVDGQGNFGSIDGDSPAAMRYTEVRMRKIAEEMLSDIDKDKCKVKLGNAEILANPISVKSKGEKTTVSLRPERALINPTDKMDNMFTGKIEEVIYHGDHTRVRLNLLGSSEFILKVPNSTSELELKVSEDINIGWNSVDARALDPK